MRWRIPPGAWATIGGGLTATSLLMAGPALTGRDAPIAGFTSAHQASQQAVGTEEVLLPDYLIQATRPHPLRKWRERGVTGRRGVPQVLRVCFVARDASLVNG